MDVMELAPGMSPACYFVDGAVTVEMMKARVRVGLQRTLEVLQMSSRVFSLAIFRVSEPHSWSG